MFLILGGVFLGWSLGSNDAANVFGTGVASKIIRYRTAIILASIFVLIGAMAEGTGGIHTLGNLTQQNPASAFIVSVAAGLTVAVMSTLKLPVSTSQAVVGSIIGMGLARNASEVNWQSLIKVGICWVGTPVGAAIIAFLLYPVLSWLLEQLRLNIITRSMVLRAGLIVGGSYGAYALGANNVANVTGVFYQTGLFSEFSLAVIGGVSIALGILTYSKNVMTTVGSRLVQLDAFSALVAVVAEAITVHIYAVIGVPVSTSQAIVGAILGIGLFKGVKTINRRTLFNIFSGWLCTPVVSGLICFVVGKLFL